MQKEFIENLESKLNRQFGYFFRCDDLKRPKEIKCDMYFYMWEEDCIISVLNLCESLDLKYDFGFQEWDNETQSLLETMYVSNNYLNQ